MKDLVLFFILFVLFFFSALFFCCENRITVVFIDNLNELNSTWDTFGDRLFFRWTISSCRCISGMCCCSGADVDERTVDIEH